MRFPGHNAKSGAKRAFTALLTTLFVFVFCLVAVCDLSCGMEQFSFASSSSFGGAGRDESAAQGTLQTAVHAHNTTIGRAHCTQCRHCEQQGFSAPSASGHAMAHLNFYRPQQEEKLSQGALQEHHTARMLFTAAVLTSPALFEARLNSGPPGTAQLLGANLSTFNSLSLPLRT